MFDQKAMVRMYTEQGLDTVQIAAVLGCTPSNVSARLNRLGVKLKRKRNIDWNPRLLRKMYVDQGMTTQQIANELGHQRVAVNKALRRFGIPMRPRGTSGSRHPCWRGGRIADKGGYILVHMPEHPFANAAGYVREHRLIMEQKLGRYLTPDEVVHHRNGRTDDNRLANLQLFQTNGKHLQKTLKGKVPRWTPEGYARIRAADPRRGRRKSTQAPSETGGQASLPSTDRLQTEHGISQIPP